MLDTPNKIRWLLLQIGILVNVVAISYHWYSDCDLLRHNQYQEHNSTQRESK